MNVQNRRLFRNKDARRQLAAMGGIMQSSPELMGEAMRFAEGGTARERAISGQGALDEFASSRRTPVDLRAIDQALGSRVQDVDRRVQTAIVSFLGNVFQVVGDRIFHSDTGVEIEEPSLKQEILTQGDRIAAEDMAMAQDIPQGQPRVFAQPEAEPEIMFPGELSRAFVPQEEIPLSLQQRIAEEDMAMAQDVPQGQPRNFTQLLSDIENPVERGKAILAQSQIDQATSDGPSKMEQMMQARSLAENQGGPMGEAAAALAAMEATPYNPMVSGDPRATMGEFMRGTGLPAAPENQETTVDEALIALEDRYKAAIANAGSYDDLSPQERMGFSAEYSMVYPDRVLVGNDRTPEEVARVTESLLPPASTSKLSSMDFSTDPTKGYPFPTDVPKDDPKYEAQSVVEAMTKSSNPAELEAQLEDIQDRKEEARRTQEMADAEREQMTGMPDLAAPEKVDVDVLLDAVEENDPKAASAAALGSAGSTPGAAKNAADVALAAAEASTNPDASLPDTISTNLGAGSSSSIEEATKAQYKFLKDFLGIGERDKQKEFNLMAMQFFTALAAGQSPDALANLNAAASTAIAGLAAGDKERTDFDRELKLAAYEQGQAQMAASVKRRDAMARAYLSAGLMPEIDEATGQITGYKVLPQKNTSTYTPERLRQTLLEQIVKSENAEDFGLFTDGKLDVAKANKLVEQMMRLGLGPVDEDSSTGDFSEMKKLEDAARERGEPTFKAPDGTTRAVRP